VLYDNIEVVSSQKVIQGILKRIRYREPDPLEMVEN
jgi:hypothetical protein